MMRVGTAGDAACYGMIEMVERNAEKQCANIYKFTQAETVEELREQFTEGNLDIAVLPTNVAAQMYNTESKKLKVVALSAIGSFSLLEGSVSLSADDHTPIESIEDISGRAIFAAGSGGGVQCVIDYLLASGDVSNTSVVYKDGSELTALLLDGGIELVVLPQPYATSVTLKDDSITEPLDIAEEWEKATDGAIMATDCIIVSVDFLEKNKGAVDKFLDDYKLSADYISSNASQAAELSEKQGLLTQQVAESVLPESGIVCMSGQEMKDAVSSYLDALATSHPDLVGGKTPDASFYYLP